MISCLQTTKLYVYVPDVEKLSARVRFYASQPSSKPLLATGTMPQECSFGAWRPEDDPGRYSRRICVSVQFDKAYNQFHKGRGTKLSEKLTRYKCMERLTDQHERIWENGQECLFHLLYASHSHFKLLHGYICLEGSASEDGLMSVFCSSAISVPNSILNLVSWF